MLSSLLFVQTRFSSRKCVGEKKCGSFWSFRNILNTGFVCGHALGRLLCWGQAQGSSCTQFWLLLSMYLYRGK